MLRRRYRRRRIQRGSGDFQDPWASPVTLAVENSPASAGDAGSIPGLQRSPGGRDDNPLQDSCLENSMDREAWWATVHGAAKSRTRLKRLSMHTMNLLAEVISGKYKCDCQAEDLIITRATVLKEKPDSSTLVFGTVFTDHMLTVEWSLELGWEKPHIKPLQNLSLHPGSSAFHYAVELFEGLKAFRGVDNKIRLFRPDLNMDRMYRSAMRATLPAFDKNELLECIQQLVKLDEEWVPYSTSASLYIRPTFIGTEPSLGVKKPTKALLFVILSPVGPYFSTGSFNPVSLWANPKYVRAWKGGTGDCKMGGNYGSSLFAQCEAVENACQQVLWLYGEDNQITEVGTMNLFLYWINEDGEEELATPPLDGIILPGVTRQSILDLAHKWGEFKVSERYLTMDDLTTAVEENRVREMFGSGTACVVCPVSTILYQDETIHIPTMENGPKLASRILEKLTDIQYGREESDWTITVA